MNLNFTLKDLALLTEGEILKGNLNDKVKSFNFDSRKIKKTDVFFALKGKKFDGNDYLLDVINKNVYGIICEKGKFPKKYLNKINFCIEVNDSLKSLHKIALSHRLKFNIPVISITGSNGKTTTKEMLNHVLSRIAPTCLNIKNFNNEYGIPFSILELSNKHKFAVFEIGASKKGDVKELADIVRPDIAIITTIGPEHLEFFKSMENIYSTETEVLDFLKKDSLVIFNGDNKYLKRLKKKKINFYSFGFNKDNDLILKPNKNYYDLFFKNKKIKIKLKNPLEHNYLNASAIFLASNHLKIKKGKIIKSLESFTGVKMRNQVLSFKKIKIIFDAYNSNPQSLSIALKEAKKNNIKTIVIGDMKELGKFSVFYHKELAKEILKNNFDNIILIGKEIKETFNILNKSNKKIEYFINTDLAKEKVTSLINENKSNILFKASRSMKFENLLPEKLREEVI